MYYELMCSSTVSPRRAATWLITEGGLSSEYRSHGLHGEKDRLEWLVSETQHFPIYVHLQAAAYR